MIAYVQHQMREYVFWINTFYCKYIADKCCIECIISHWLKYRSSSSWTAEFNGCNFLGSSLFLILVTLLWVRNYSKMTENVRWVDFSHKYWYVVQIKCIHQILYFSGLLRILNQILILCKMIFQSDIFSFCMDVHIHSAILSMSPWRMSWDVQSNFRLYYDTMLLSIDIHQ